MPATKERIALYIPAAAGDRHTDFRTLSPYFVRITETDEIRNLFSWNDSDEFSDLRFHCQWERNKETLEYYGTRLEYDGVTVSTSTKAARMVKMMRKAEKVRQEFAVMPTTFGQFVTLLCAGLGVKLAVIPSPGSASFFDYSERKHTFLKIGEESQRAIDGVMSESWKADHPNASLSLSDGRQLSA